jgi:hypothetical protein
MTFYAIIYPDDDCEEFVEVQMRGHHDKYLKRQAAAQLKKPTKTKATSPRAKTKATSPPAKSNKKPQSKETEPRLSLQSLNEQLFQLWSIHTEMDPKNYRLPAIHNYKFSQSTQCLIATFFLFMYERQMIFFRCKQNARQLSTIRVFQRWSFCNNYRELDRGTRYFHSHILARHDQAILQSNMDRLGWVKIVLWDAYVYRLVNRVDSFSRIGGIPERSKKAVKEFLKKCEDIFATGKLFTGAHQAPSLQHFGSNLNLLVKPGSVLDKVALILFEATDLKSCYKALSQNLPGVGMFTAWQLICDLQESRAISFDNDDFIALGPGAERMCVVVFVTQLSLDLNHLFSV